jgi:hypothetical protein
MHLVQHARTFRALERMAQQANCDATATTKSSTPSLTRAAETARDAAGAAADLLAGARWAVGHHAFAEVETQQHLCCTLMEALSRLAQDTNQDATVRRATASAIAGLDRSGVAWVSTSSLSSSAEKAAPERRSTSTSTSGSRPVRVFRTSGQEEVEVTTEEPDATTTMESTLRRFRARL